MCYIRKLIFVQIAIDISIYIINCHFGDKEEQGMELRDWNDLLQDEDGMGTVEIILIMVTTWGRDRVFYVDGVGRKINVLLKGTGYKLWMIELVSGICYF